VIFDSDVLGEFEAEPSRVSLAQLLDRGVPIHWDEAVAIVEALSDVLVPAHAGESPVPSLAEIFVTDEGNVVNGEPGRGENGPAAIGRVLHALLGQTDVPVALRLFVTQSTAPETYTTIRQFAAGLAYFGKPGNVERIQAVARRYRSMPEPAKNLTPLPLHQPVDTPQPETSPAPDPPKNVEARKTVRMFPRVSTWHAPLAAAIVLLVGAAWIWSTGRVSGVRTEGAMPSAGLEADTPSDSDAAVAETVAPAAPATSDTPVRTTAAAPRPRPETSRPAAVRTAREQGGSTAPSRSQAQSDATVASSAPAAAVPEAAAANSVDSRGASVPEVDQTVAVYSSEDGDVQPPVLLFPQLPRPLFTDQQNDMVNRMEIVVSADGSVERVRLLDGPTRMPDMMLLSGAKMWRFAPALRDGEPVRYRTVVTWTGAP
jgi:hypothetical protein